MTPTPDVPDHAPWCVAPDPEPRVPRFPVPQGACDCHAHICGPIAEHAYAQERLYTPPDALLPAYRRMLGRLGVTRAVLVQPSVYGTDNRVLTAALATDPAGLRGVAVVDPAIGDAELRALDRLGVRGVRINVVDRRAGRNQVPLDEVVPLARRVAPLGWHVELLLQVDAVPDLAPLLRSIQGEVVLGHLGYVHAARGGAGHPGFGALLRVLEAGRCWVKLTGPYRISAEGLPFADILPMAQALAEAAPERLLWGSDWPHVMMRGDMPNDGDLFGLLERWVPDPATRRQILVENPAQLYGFPSLPTSRVSPRSGP